MNKNMIANLIGAGSVTALIVALVLLFGGSGSPVTASGGEGLQDNGVSAEAYESVQQQNEQLEEALLTMQEREGIYQSQLEEANTALNEQAVAAYGEGEYEEEEAEEYEEEEEEEYEEEEEEHDE